MHILKKALATGLISMIFSISSAEIIGTPLSSFRSQSYATCWAYAGFHMYEGAIESQTGQSYYLSQDKSFWYDIFRHRLLYRWAKGEELCCGLHDSNIFTEFGTVESVIPLMNQSRLVYYRIKKTNQLQPTKQYLFDLQGANGGQSDWPWGLDLSDMQPEFSQAKTLTEVEAIIDSYLRSKGLTPRGDRFTAGGKLQSAQEFVNSIMKFSNVAAIDELVWINIDYNSKEQELLNSRLEKSEIGIIFMTEGVSPVVIEKMLDRALELKIPPVLGSSSHMVTVFAKDKSTGKYYIADSGKSYIESTSTLISKDDYFQIIDVHLPKSFLIREFGVKDISAVPRRLRLGVTKDGIDLDENLKTAPAFMRVR